MDKLVEDYLAGKEVMIGSYMGRRLNIWNFTFTVCRESAISDKIEDLFVLIDMMEWDESAKSTDPMIFVHLGPRGIRAAYRMYPHSENLIKISTGTTHDYEAVAAKKDVDVGLPRDVWYLVLLYSESITWRNSLKM